MSCLKGTVTLKPCTPEYLNRDNTLRGFFRTAQHVLALIQSFRRPFREDGDLLGNGIADKAISIRPVFLIAMFSKCLSDAPPRPSSLRGA